MKAERAYPRFTITAKGTRWVEGGHPWIYAQEIVSAPEGVRKAFEDALAGLKDMARGVIIFQAEGVPTANTDASGGVRLDVPSRIFSPDSLKGF